MKITRITYNSTHYYFIDTGNGLLAFDAGWPGSYKEYKDCLKAEGYTISNIRWLIVSHFHMDHAGLAGMLSDKGTAFYVFKSQLFAIGEMEKLITGKNMPYHLLDKNKMIVREITESRSLLQSIGINGEILHTNGHSEDSISLLLDTGEAFIGDLPPESMIADDDDKSKSDWQLLKSKGAKFIKPAHAHEFKIESG